MMPTSVAERLAPWAQYLEISGWIPGSKLGNAKFYISCGLGVTGTQSNEKFTPDHYRNIFFVLWYA